jgi:hypothetical protein
MTGNIILIVVTKLVVGIVTGLSSSLPGCKKSSWNVVENKGMEVFEVEGSYNIREWQDR